MGAIRRTEHINGGNQRPRSQAVRDSGPNQTGASAVHGSTRVRLALIVDEASAQDLGGGLSAERDIEVSGTATTVTGGRDLLAARDPDVVIVDIQLPDGYGFLITSEAVARGRPDTILRSVAGAIDDLEAALRIGAKGFVLPATPIADLADAVRIVAAGGNAFVTDVLHRAPLAVQLSQREREVVRLVLASQANAEIAGVLGLATQSVEAYLSRLYARIGVRGRVELALRAEREGWLETN